MGPLQSEAIGNWVCFCGAKRIRFVRGLNFGVRVAFGKVSFKSWF
jgi:hypothetical protein